MEIKFVFRNFPLSEMHQYARVAAIAAEAANLQGKFREMHDGIYENQEDLLMKLAEQLKLNIPQFEKEMKSIELAEKVDADIESGIVSGVNGTPLFYINGKKFDDGAENLLEVVRENVK